MKNYASVQATVEYYMAKSTGLRTEFEHYHPLCTIVSVIGRDKYIKIPDILSVLQNWKKINAFVIR